MERCAPTGRAPCWPALDERSPSTATGEAKVVTEEPRGGGGVTITGMVSYMSVQPDWCVLAVIPVYSSFPVTGSILSLQRLPELQPESRNAGQRGSGLHARLQPGP